MLVQIYKKKSLNIALEVKLTKRLGINVGLEFDLTKRHGINVGLEVELTKRLGINVGLSPGLWVGAHRRRRFGHEVEIDDGGSLAEMQRKKRQMIKSSFDKGSTKNFY